MSSFIGSYIHSLDEKGRVSLPSKMRKALSPEADEQFVLALGFERCLLLYPANEWKKIEAKLLELSPFNEDHRLFLRSFLESASECSLDRQGRIMIPQEFLQFAGITGPVRIIGMLDKMELWDPEEYKKYRMSRPETYESIAAKAMGQTTR